MCKKPFLILIGVWEKNIWGSAAKNLPDVDDIARRRVKFFCQEGGGNMGVGWRPEVGILPRFKQCFQM